ncbi:MAG TPA: aminoglycoside phosphotransferase family protein, partial [Acidobacteriaceae bacterium]|nr:aminoglycoside phosphotransferase family protein [Acidobacteriaceae bacterium]
RRMTADAQNRSVQSLSVIAQRFAIPGEFMSALSYGSGHINDTYRVVFRSPSGGEEQFILQRINTHVFHAPQALMENIARVTAHLAAKVAGQPDSHRQVLTLVPTREGQPVSTDEEGGLWRCYRFVEDTCSYDIVDTPERARAAAFAFGRFQSLLADLPAPRLHDTIPGFHDTPARLRAFEQALAADSAGRASSAQPEIDFLLARRTLAHRLIDASLPERITHNDAKINNVLFDNTNGEGACIGICVIDLDTVMPGLALYDFGDMVRTMTSSAAEDETDLSLVEMRFVYFQAIARGYLAGAGGALTLAEKRLLIAAGQVITYEQALRFLSDHLAGDPYYKIHRPNHNLDRCRTQIRLLSSIESQEAEMHAFLQELLREPSL